MSRTPVPNPKTQDLGKLISRHGTAAVYLQRAAIVVGLSFLFFLSTLILYNIWGDVVYFLLSSAFLILHLFTLVGWWMRKRDVVRIYENGLEYRKFRARWDEITRVEARADSGVQVTKTGGETATLSRSVAEIGTIARTIKTHLPA